MTSQHILEDSHHVRIGGVDLIDDKELPKERRRSQVRMAHSQRREEDLINCSNDNATREVALRSLACPAPISKTSFIGPQNLEMRKLLCIGVVDPQIAGNREHDGWRRLERTLDGIVHALVHLGRSGPGGQREVKAIDGSGAEQSGKARQSGFGFAAARLAFENRY